jgi:hypothetical protein
MSEQTNTSGKNGGCAVTCFFLQFVRRALTLHFRAVSNGGEVVW